MWLAAIKAGGLPYQEFRTLKQEVLSYVTNNKPQVTQRLLDMHAISQEQAESWFQELEQELRTDRHEADLISLMPLAITLQTNIVVWNTVRGHKAAIISGERPEGDSIEYPTNDKFGKSRIGSTSL